MMYFKRSLEPVRKVIIKKTILKTNPIKHRVKATIPNIISISDVFTYFSVSYFCNDIVLPDIPWQDNLGYPSGMAVYIII